MIPSAPTVVTASLLEKAAVDNGFDRELPREEMWLTFASSRCSLRVWLGSVGDALYLVALSQQNVARALGDVGSPIAGPLPPGALGGRAVTDIPTLDRLLRRVFQLARTVPDELLRAFERRTAGMPRSTEAERLVVQRVGQEFFRAGLLEFWEGRCAVTGLAVPELLRASHIKRWADCETDTERLDVFNGLLLAPHLDAAFDLGFITVSDDGAVVVSDALPGDARRLLGFDVPARVRTLAAGHQPYLAWHRAHWFKKQDRSV